MCLLQFLTISDIQNAKYRSDQFSMVSKCRMSSHPKKFRCCLNLYIKFYQKNEKKKWLLRVNYFYQTIQFVAKLLICDCFHFLVLGGVPKVLIPSKDPSLLGSEYAVTRTAHNLKIDIFNVFKYPVYIPGIIFPWRGVK